MGLRDDGARPDDLPTLAPRVARGTHLIQPTKGRRQVFCLWQGALPGGFTRPIDVKDYPVVSRSIYQPPVCFSLIVRGRGEQIVEKERAQGFDGASVRLPKSARAPSGRAAGHAQTRP